jgi:hypothetical protein
MIVAFNDLAQYYNVRIMLQLRENIRDWKTQPTVHDSLRCTEYVNFDEETFVVPEQ